MNPFTFGQKQAGEYDDEAHQIREAIINRLQQSQGATNSQVDHIAAGHLGAAANVGIGAGVGAMVNGRKGAVRGGAAGLGTGVGSAIAQLAGAGPVTQLGATLAGGVGGYLGGRYLTPDEEEKQAAVPYTFGQKQADGSYDGVPVSDDVMTALLQLEPQRRAALQRQLGTAAGAGFGLGSANLLLPAAGLAGVGALTNGRKGAIRGGLAGLGTGAGGALGAMAGMATNTPSLALAGAATGAGLGYLGGRYLTPDEEEKQAAGLQGLMMDDTNWKSFMPQGMSGNMKPLPPKPAPLMRPMLPKPGIGGATVMPTGNKAIQVMQQPALKQSAAFDFGTEIAQHMHPKPEAPQIKPKVVRQQSQTFRGNDIGGGALAAACR